MTTLSTSGAAASSSATALAVRLPASLFSVVMGVGALAAAWRAAARAYAVSPWVADALLALSAGLWVALLVAQGVKAFAAPERLRAELEHPVEGSLAALGPASLLLLAAGLAVHSRGIASALFWTGAAAQLALGVWLFGRWLTGAVEPKLVTPALYLPPVVGNLLAALAASAVGQGDAAWLFFGAGVVAWIVIGATLLGRYLSAGELPAELRPLLALELAPPALALVAWQALAGAGQDEVSRTLLGWSLFVALVLLRLAGRLRAVPFGPAYWAFTFPLAALSTATLRLTGPAPSSVGAAIALPLFVVANAVVALIAFRTVTAASRGEPLGRG